MMMVMVLLDDEAALKSLVRCLTTRAEQRMGKCVLMSEERMNFVVGKEELR